MDSDDKWHPQKLELIYRFLNDSSVQFIGHGHTLKDNSSLQFEPKEPCKISFMRLLVKNFAVTPSVVIKKELCEYFDESMTHTKDHELWLRIALKTDVYYLDLLLTILGRPQLSQGGLSANRWAMRKGELRMYKNIVSYKKMLAPLYPFLFIFSFSKHLRHMIMRFICNKLA